MGHRLLAVDDDPSTLKLVSRCGELAGYATCAVGDAASFRTALTEFSPTLLVIDIVLPDEDGIAILRTLAGAEHRPPVILISVFENTYLPAARRLADAYNLSVIATLGKPLHIADMIAALDAAKTWTEQRSIGSGVLPTAYG